MSGNVSDHNPILWQTVDKIETPRRGILNEDLLDEQEIIENLKKDTF